MSKNVKVNGVDYSGVSQVQLKTTDGGTALFKDVDEITEPSGSVTITENGTHDVSNYAQAVVNVAGEGESYLDMVKFLCGGASEEIDFIIPSGITKIRANFLRDVNDTNLKSVTIPEGVTFIGSHAFYFVSRTTINELPITLETIEAQAFYYCFGLGGGALEFKIPAAVKSIGEFAFYQSLRGVKTLTFLGTPTDINAKAFNTCTFDVLNVPWAEGEVDNFPWGATFGTVNYNYTGE